MIYVIKNLVAKITLILANVCKHVFISNIPVFNDLNSNQQLRFITLIDIFYEKKIELTISCEKNLEKLGSSQLHKEKFLNEHSADFMK